MGIPVVSFTGRYSFALEHPVATGFFVLGLFVAAVALYDCGHSFSRWIVKSHPRNAARVRAGMWVVLIAGGAAGLWGAFKTQPSYLEQIQQGAQQILQDNPKHISNK